MFKNIQLGVFEQLGDKHLTNFVNFDKKFFDIVIATKVNMPSH